VNHVEAGLEHSESLLTNRGRLQASSSFIIYGRCLDHVHRGRGNREILRYEEGNNIVGGQWEPI
jgi:hypothetical protein